MSTNVTEHVEKLAEQVVSTEPSDLRGLAEMHTGLLEVASWAREQNAPRTADAATKSAELVESIILGECADAAEALNAVGAAVTTYQQVTRGDVPDADAEYPGRLVGEATGGSGFTVSLPPYVDEAIFSEFLTRQQGGLEDMEELILATEHGGDENKVAELRRQIHTLKGEAALLGLEDVERLCHTVEEHLQSEELGACTDGLLAMKDWLNRTFSAYAGQGEPPGSVDEVLEQFTAAEAAPTGAGAGGAAKPGTEGAVNEPAAEPPAVDTEAAGPEETGEPEIGRAHV